MGRSGGEVSGEGVACVDVSVGPSWVSLVGGVRSSVAVDEVE